VSIPKKDEITYTWERAIRPPESGPDSVFIKRPFPDEILELHREAWAWGVARYNPKWRDLPELRFNIRMTRTVGQAGYRWAKRDGETYPVRVITLGFNGLTRGTLLHEIAHHLVGLEADHGPIFCRCALDLYVAFLGVNETAALEIAASLGVRVAWPTEARAA
jgi:hypothetical protein